MFYTFTNTYTIWYIVLDKKNNFKLYVNVFVTQNKKINQNFPLEKI